MRTKTMLLSALLGTLGSVSLMAQSSNVYSLNAVGYINVTIPTNFSVLSCPLIASPDNSLATLFPASNAAFNGLKFFLWTNGGYASGASYKNGKWVNGGTDELSPGTAGFMFNGSGAPVTITFVGQVPSGGTNVLLPGFNLVSSILPVNGVTTNTGNAAINLNGFGIGDKAFVWDNEASGYEAGNKVLNSGKWNSVPSLPDIVGGFFYYNAAATANSSWVENFSVGQ